MHIISELLSWVPLGLVLSIALGLFVGPLIAD